MSAPVADDRHQLFAVAYRMLGSVHDAEDAVQEGLIRWHSMTEEQRAEIRVPQAWLTRVVSRICLDQLGSARIRRESYTGIWLPEPVAGEPVATAPAPSDPADAVTLDESVSLALLRAMEQLTPAERVSLILHDAFAVPFDEIADIVGRTPQACRQLATSARRHIREQPRYAVQGPERDAVVAAFAKACQDGDVEALAAVLSPDVVSRSDGGGAVNAARRPVHGATNVARFLLGVLAQPANTELTYAPALVNGRTGLVARQHGVAIGVVDLAVVGNRVAEIAIVVNPEKLSAIQ